MATYLLLRNNKETGPYSLEALIQLGLKPYDLVWVEGKSAAWRYPSEVEGLKFYAAAVEEQPFDRFYKKPSEEKAKQEQPKQVVEAVVAKPIVIPVETVKQEVIQTTDTQQAEVNMPKKQVYVSMPANSGKTIIIKKNEKAAVAAVATSTVAAGTSVNDSFMKQPEAVNTTVPEVDSYAPSYSDLINDYNKQQYYEKKATLQQTPVQKTTQPVKEAEKTEVLETKYSQSLDDIKDMYVQTLTDRKKKNAQRKMMMNMAKKGLPFAAVLIIGFVLGSFLMNKNSGKQTDGKTQGVVATPVTNDNAKKDNVAAQTDQSSQPQQTVPVADPQVTESKPGTNNATDLSKQTTVQKDNAITASTEQTSSFAGTKKNSKTDSKTTKIADNNSNAQVQPKSVETDPTTGERNKVVRNDADNSAASASSTSKPIANPLMKQVSVASNDYKRGTFGGIHDLQLTVNNNSNYLLDNVVVELQLLKPNDQPIKTDNIRFSPVPPNGSLTLAIPATNRGVKVAYRIVHVESKSAGNDTAGLK